MRIEFPKCFWIGNIQNKSKRLTESERSLNEVYIFNGTFARLQVVSVGLVDFQGFFSDRFFFTYIYTLCGDFRIRLTAGLKMEVFLYFLALNGFYFVLALQKTNATEAVVNRIQWKIDMFYEFELKRRRWISHERF